MRKIKKFLHFYMIAVFLDILLWMFFPGVGGAVGASSLIHGFICFITFPTGWIKGISLAWVILFSVSIVWSYVIACKKDNCKPMIFLMGAELIVAGAYILYIVHIDTDSPDLSFTIIGFVMRVLYWIIVVYKFRKYLVISRMV